MDVRDAILAAERDILILGIVPLASWLTRPSPALASLLAFPNDVRLTCLHESESELFFASLVTDHPSSHPRISFTKMRELRNRALRTLESAHKRAGVPAERLRLREVNLRTYLSAVFVDQRDLYVKPWLPGDINADNYLQISVATPWFEEINRLLTAYDNDKGPGVYNSLASDEMLVMYDRESVPRGIFPRKAFYNTDFQRYSVWLLVFARDGRMLLHKCAPDAKDNRGMWDKSAGGHVDIADLSSSHAAERELLEELYLPDAEYTRYMRENPRDVINLGVWRPEKRGYERALEDIYELGPDDWAYFALPDQVQRTSQRFVHESKLLDATSTVMETKFISDVFFFVAPSTFASRDFETLSRAAGIEHRLVDIADLLHWVESEKSAGLASAQFTDDLLYICDYFRDRLEQFAEMLRATNRP
ncbi:MAG TPA: NUDIX domain-containing protein [Gemmatimonadaceae bacterium]|nr:NUDIX domain-containing protein [Gemmatimonadaceae bacterium]